MSGVSKKLITSIQGFFTGILAFFTGLLRGKKKNNGYFLELDESKGTNLIDSAKGAAKELASNAKEAAQTVASNAKEATQTVVSNAKEAAQTVASNAKEATQTVASNAKEATQTVASNTEKATQTIASETPTPSNGTKNTVAKPEAKSTKKAKSAAGKNPKPADVELVQTAEGLRIEPGNNAKAASAKVVKEESKETTFAPKYLSPSATSSNGRRRPGANMSAFLELARQIKTPG